MRVHSANSYVPACPLNTWTLLFLQGSRGPDIQGDVPLNIAPQHAMKKRSVLIVDNNPGVRRELEAVIRRHCFFDEVVAVGSPEEAQEVAGTLRPDLVIYDLTAYWSL